MKFYLYLFSTIAVIGSYYGTYTYGGRVVEARYKEALVEEGKRENKAISEVQDAKVKRDIIYRDRVKIVESFQDDSGCLDNPTPDDLLKQLHDARNSQ